MAELDYIRSKMTEYNVFINGVHAGNVSATNVKSAITVFCRANNIPVMRIAKVSACGSTNNKCHTDIYGNRYCGNINKCTEEYAAFTGNGVVTAVQ